MRDGNKRDAGVARIVIFIEVGLLNGSLGLVLSRHEGPSWFEMIVEFLSTPPRLEP